MSLKRLGVNSVTNLEFQLESQGTRRRAQLIRAAAHVIATEGLKACDHARVSELTGTTRSLVYKYFPKREDMLFGVTQAAEEWRNQHADPKIVERGIMGLVEGIDKGGYSANSTKWVNHYVEHPDIASGGRDFSIAAITIARAVLVEDILGKHTEAFKHRIESIWLEPFRRSGLGDIEAQAATACMLALIHHMQLRGLAGEIDPQQSRDLFLKMAHGIVRSLL